MIKVLIFIFIISANTLFAEEIVEKRVDCSFKVSTSQLEDSTKKYPTHYYGLLVKVYLDTESNKIVDTKFLTGKVEYGVGSTYAYPPFAYPSVSYTNGIVIDFGSLTAEESMKLMTLSEMKGFPNLYRGFSIGTFTKGVQEESLSVISLLTTYSNIKYNLESSCKFR